MVEYGPKIVTNGLIMYLDAANSKSYPGYGTVWKDLSGNGFNGNIINGSYFSNINGGVIGLTAANSQYIDVYINLPGIYDSGTPLGVTTIAACRYSGSTRGRIISSYANNWLLGHWNNSTENYYAAGWVTPGVQTGTSDTQWRVLTGVSTNSALTYKLYVNGNLTEPGPGSGTTNPLQGFSLGRYNGNSEYSDCQISFICMYNRILSPQEILQNYNAIKNRFNLA